MQGRPQDIPTLRPLGSKAILPAARSSQAFPGFIAPSLLTEEATATLLTSTGNSNLKQIVLERSSEFLPPNCDPAMLHAAGVASLSLGIAPDQQLLSRIASETSDQGQVFGLLSTFAATLSPDQTLAVLAALGPPFHDLLVSGAEVELPRTPNLEAVLQRLRGEKKIKYQTPRSKTRPFKVAVL